MGHMTKDNITSSMNFAEMIITHDGVAHIDEVLSIALLFWHHDEWCVEKLWKDREVLNENYDGMTETKHIMKAVKIERTRGIDRDLKFTIVLDMGNETDYDKNKSVLRIDHHQDKNLHCTAYQIAEIAAPWMLEYPPTKVLLERINAMDTGGPNAIGGIDMISPLLGIEWGIVELFEKDPSNPIIWDMLTSLISHWYEQWEKYSELKIRMYQSLKKETLYGINFLMPHEFGMDRLVEYIVKEYIDANDIHLTVSEGRKGIRIYVTPKYQNEIKLTCIMDEVFGGHENILFKHKGGFLIELKEYIEKIQDDLALLLARLNLSS